MYLIQFDEFISSVNSEKLKQDYGLIYCVYYNLYVIVERVISIEIFCYCQYRRDNYHASLGGFQTKLHSPCISLVH
jgi:hypothetical protein